MGPEKMYDTHLTAVYLRNNTTEEYINPRNGELSVNQSDYYLPGVNGLDLEIKRIYKSNTANVNEMRVKYVNGAWVDYIVTPEVYKDENSTETVSSFYEDHYNIGMGMRFSFPMLEVKKNTDDSHYIYLHSESGDVYTLEKKYLENDSEKEEWFNDDILSRIDTTDFIYLPAGQTVKDVFVAESTKYNNGQSDGQSTYVMFQKNGKHTYFSSDGRILAIRDQYSNTITFKYTTVSYRINERTVEKKLISEIIDTLGRVTTLTYKEDSNFRVNPISHAPKANSYEEMQNPNDINSGDCQGKFEVIITLPTGDTIKYVKSAVLVSDSGQVIRTRLQTVYDKDDKAKYHYWYEQPSLGFTFHDGTNYSVFNRYEYLVQVDYCKTNEIRRYKYETYTKGLNDGSMQYRKVFQKQRLQNEGYNNGETSILKRFKALIVEQENYKYTNEPDGYSFSGYNGDSDEYLKDTYRYKSEITDLVGNQTIKTYDGLHQLKDTIKQGKDHKQIITTEHDEYKLIVKKRTEDYRLLDNQVVGTSVSRFENYRYDKYGNLVNYTGPLAERDAEGDLVNTLYTTTFAYDYNKYHNLKQKTWKVTDETSAQIIFELNSKGDALRSTQQLDDQSIVTTFKYDDKGNMIEKNEHGNRNYVTYYEYENGGAYLTRQYNKIDGKDISTYYSYDDEGNILNITDTKGNVTTNEYDKVGRIIKTTFADGNYDIFQYNESPIDNLEVIYTNKLENRYKYVYNVQGKEVSDGRLVDSSWITNNKTKYNCYGQVVETIDSLGNKVTYHYDSKQRLITKKYFDGNIFKEEVSVEYNLNDDSYPYATIMTDEEGYKQKLYYDIANRLVKVSKTPDNMTYYHEYFAYDLEGNRTEYTDGMGHTSRYIYDKASRLKEEIDAAGYHTKYEYDGANLLVKRIEPDNKITEYIYDYQKRITTEKAYISGQKDQFVINKAFDSNGNLIEETTSKYEGTLQRLSKKVTYNYDELNQPTDKYQWINSDDKIHTEYAYDANGNKVLEKQYMDKDEISFIKVISTFNQNNLLCEEQTIEIDNGKELNKSLVKMEYSLNDQLIEQQVLTENGLIPTNYTYDHRGNLKRISISSNEDTEITTTFDYDKVGNRVSESLIGNGNSYTTLFKYDGLGRLIKQINSLGHVNRYAYDANDNLNKEVDGRYASLSMDKAPGKIYIYDEVNRHKRTDMFDGETTTVYEAYDYDGRGNILKSIKGEGYITDSPSLSIGDVHTYNALNKVISVTSAEEYSKNSGSSSCYIYDGEGRKTKVVEPNGAQYIYTYDLLGRILEVVYPDSSKEKYVYNLAGNSISHTNQRGYTDTKKINMFGEVIEETAPNGTKFSYVYSPDGKLLEQINNYGDENIKIYNNLGQLIEDKILLEDNENEKIYKVIVTKYDIRNLKLSKEFYKEKFNKSDNSFERSKPLRSTSFEYDNAGQLINSSGPEGKENVIEYDEAGNIVMTKNKIETSKWMITRYNYNLLSLPSEKFILMDVEDVDRTVSGVAYDSQYSNMLKVGIAYVYNKSGQLSKVIDPLGNAESYTYDYNGNLIAKTDKKSIETLYSYDVTNKIISETDGRGKTKTFTYDKMGRLLTKSMPYGDNEYAISSYDYDKAGNVIRETRPNEYRENTNLNDLSGKCYTYDEMNNVLSMTDYSGDLITKMSYNYRGELLVSNVGGRQTLYTYDKQGNMIKKTDPIGSVSTFTYDIFGNMLSYIDSNNFKTQYVYNKNNKVTKIIYADGNFKEFRYDKLQNLVEEIDQIGNSTLYEYTSFGEVSSIRDALNNKTVYVYDILGRNTEITDSRGAAFKTQYDELDRVSKKITPVDESGSRVINRVEQFTYDEVGNVLSISSYEKETRKDSRTKYFTYFDDNKVKTETLPSGLTKKYGYDKNGNITSLRLEVDKQVRETKYSYDSNDRMLKQMVILDKKGLDFSEAENIDYFSDDEGNIMAITEYEYDKYGNRTRTYNPKAFYYSKEDEKRNAFSSQSVYDKLDRLVSVSYVFNNKEYDRSFSYDSLNNLISETDELGRETQYTYDSLSRLIETRDHRGEVFTKEYDPIGNIVEEVNPLGQSLTYVFDKLNRVINIVDSNGVTITTNTYDSLGNLLTYSDALGNITEYSYNLANNMTAYLKPQTREVGSEYTERFQYNIYGEMVSKENAYNNMTTYLYDHSGNLIQVKDPLGSITQYKYDGMGNKVSMVDGLGHLTIYDYNDYGYLISTTNAVGLTTSYDYDIVGNQVSETDKLGQKIAYKYDSGNRLIEKNNTNTNEKMTYAYDVLGNRTSMSDESGMTEYSYNTLDQLSSRSKDGTQEIAYEYDLIGNIIKVSVGSKEIEYAYDYSSRLISVTYDGEETSYTYDDAGNRKSMQYPNQVSVAYVYDKNNQVVAIVNKKQNEILSSLTYTYDLAERVTLKENHIGITKYAYDDSGQLVKEEAPGYITKYNYDRSGNMTVKESTYKSLQPTRFNYKDTEEKATYKTNRTLYIYNNANQLLRASDKMFAEEGEKVLERTTTYTYDRNGNQTSQISNYVHPHTVAMLQEVDGQAYKNSEVPEEGYNSLVERAQYSYDGFNRLTKVSKYNNSIHKVVTFSYNGDDLRVTKSERESSSNYQENSVNYIYDRQYVIQERYTDKADVFYIRGIKYIAMDSDSLSYYIYNGHGDVIQTLDASGSIENQYIYDAFGNTTFTHENTQNSIRYSGEFFDESTGLYYLRARYYNPHIGRFISEDTYWGEDNNPSSLNRYAYCYNDPIQFIDPTGHYGGRNGEHDDSKLNDYDEKRILDLTDMYNSTDDENVKEMIHRAAESIRARANRTYLKEDPTDSGTLNEDEGNAINNAYRDKVEKNKANGRSYLTAEEWQEVSIKANRESGGRYQLSAESLNDINSVRNSELSKESQEDLVENIRNWEFIGRALEIVSTNEPFSDGYEDAIISNKAFLAPDIEKRLSYTTANNSVSSVSTIMNFKIIVKQLSESYKNKKESDDYSFGELMKTIKGLLDIDDNPFTLVDNKETKDYSEFENVRYINNVDEFLRILLGEDYGDLDWLDKDLKSELLKGYFYDPIKGVADFVVISCMEANRKGSSIPYVIITDYDDKENEKDNPITRLRSVSEKYGEVTYMLASESFLDDLFSLTKIKKFFHKPTSGIDLIANQYKTTTILGRYSDDMKYIIDDLGYADININGLSSNKGGFNVLNITESYNYEDFWDLYNQPFLDAALSRGDDILLATKVTPDSIYKNKLISNPGEWDNLTGFGREIYYLLKHGYELASDGVTLIKK